MSEALASHYAVVSSNDNYDLSFFEEKIRAEAHLVQFEDTPSQSYNQPISETELQIVIHKNFKNSAPGADKILMLCSNICILTPSHIFVSFLMKF